MNSAGTVLVVEDDHDICDAVVESLEDAGYRVSIAANGAIAFEALQTSDDLPCLVLLDLMMPVMDGERFLKEIRKVPRMSALPVVLVTADGHATTKAANLGALAGLTKPIKLDDLLSTVSRYCQRH